MASALLWPSFKENYFKIWDTGASADAPVSLFSRVGTQRGTVLAGCPLPEPSQAHIRSPAPPKGELLAWWESFLLHLML